jgi:LysM repeat protein
VFLVLISLLLALGAPGATPPAPQTSALPATEPGLSRDEGVFLVSVDPRGAQIAYFIAGNVRHSITTADMQAEQRLNPLWPVRVVLPQDVVTYAEGAPIGTAKQGILAPASAPVAAPKVAPADAEPQAAPSTPSSYVLKIGDNLTRLADRFGTSVEELLEANGMANANRIYAGQTIAIPGPSTSDAPAQRVEAPSAPAPVAQDEPAVAEDSSTAETATTYTVQPGDSAIRIARRLGVDQDELMSANGISNANRIYAGQVLQVPGA